MKNRKLHESISDGLSALSHYPDNKIAYLYDGKSHQDAKQEFVAVKDILEPWNQGWAGRGYIAGRSVDSSAMSTIHLITRVFSIVFFRLKIRLKSTLARNMH